MKRMVWMAAVLVTMAAGTAWATEGGGGAYPNGAEGFMAGAVPPPGDYILDYVTYYTADTLAGPDGDDLVPVFDLTVWANTVRYLHVSKTTLLGGLWGMHVFLPVLNVDVTTPGGSDSRTAVGDIIVDPFILSWHSPSFHAVCGLDVYVPSGSFDENEMANASRGYWTIEPVAGASYLGAGGLDVSLKVMYDFNLENPDTDYTSGQELHADFAVAQKLGPVSVGVGGYAYKQITDDESDAPAAMVMGKGQTVALGPQVKYDVGRFSVIAKYQTEFATENKPEGEKAWLKFIYAF